jgi:hypothetical protein
MRTGVVGAADRWDWTEPSPPKGRRISHATIIGVIIGGVGKELVVCDRRFYNGGTNYPGSRHNFKNLVRQQWITKVMLVARNPDAVTGKDINDALDLEDVPFGPPREKLVSRLAIWVRPANQRRYLAAAGDAVRIAIAGSGSFGRPVQFVEMEIELDKLRLEKNRAGLPVTAMWIACTARHLCRTLYKGTPKALEFKASPGWFAGYASRYLVVTRRVTNKKKWCVFFAFLMRSRPHLKFEIIAGPFAR